MGVSLTADISQDKPPLLHLVDHGRADAKAQRDCHRAIAVPIIQQRLRPRPALNRIPGHVNRPVPDARVRVCVHGTRSHKLVHQPKHGISGRSLQTRGIIPARRIADDEPGLRRVLLRCLFLEEVPPQLGAGAASDQGRPAQIRDLGMVSSPVATLPDARLLAAADLDVC